MAGVFSAGCASAVRCDASGGAVFVALDVPESTGVPGSCVAQQDLRRIDISAQQLAVEKYIFSCVV